MRTHPKHGAHPSAHKHGRATAQGQGGTAYHAHTCAGRQQHAPHHRATHAQVGIVASTQAACTRITHTLATAQGTAREIRAESWAGGAPLGRHHAMLSAHPPTHTPQTHMQSPTRGRRPVTYAGGSRSKVARMRSKIMLVQCSASPSRRPPHTHTRRCARTHTHTHTHHMQWQGRRHGLRGRGSSEGGGVLTIENCWVGGGVTTPIMPFGNADA